jgi:23S rRNA (guanosine2251-2'-O)-methyltransferase
MSDDWRLGIHAVESALEVGASQVIELWIEKGTRNPRVLELAEAARGHGIAVQSVGKEGFTRIAHDVRHQGIAARCRAEAVLDERELGDLIESAGSEALLLVLDGVTDPHNLGACLRSAHAAGACAVLIPKDRSAAMTPVVRRAAAGAAERLPLVRATNLARALDTVKEAGVWLTGLAGDAPQTLFDIDLRGRVALVMGSEGEGMRRLTAERCDHLAHIPMHKGAESLNVSVAPGVALFEAVRQRRTPPRR